MDLNRQQLQFDYQTALALVQASQAIISDPQLDQVLKHVATQAAKVVRAEAASVLLLNQAGDTLRFVAAIGPNSSQLIGESFDAKLGIAGQAIHKKRSVRVNDVKVNRHFFEGVDLKTHMQTRSIIAAPLIHLGQVVGVVEVINPKHTQTFPDADVELVQVFANLAAAAVRMGQKIDSMSRDNLALRAAMSTPAIIGQSPAMVRVLDLCQKVAPTATTVLITGETGTGKELFARAIHDLSPRSDKPFIAVNCAALPEMLLESELFGHEKGAFTGADHQKPGRFELAEGGSLFLDELGEMTRSTQVKLLRVLQEREFVRVGGTQTIRCDARIIAATNRDLKEAMDQGQFRQDLYYRLHVFPVALPPLRQRLEDLPILIDHIIAQVIPNLGVGKPTLTQPTLDALLAYTWPGNIRELRNVIERCTLLAAGGVIHPHNLPSEFAQDAVAVPAAVSGTHPSTTPGITPGTPPGTPPSTHPSVQTAALSPNRNPLPPAPMAVVPLHTGSPSSLSALAKQEQTMILQSLADNHWNQTATARALGVSRDHLRYRIKKYGLKKPGSVDQAQ